MQNKYRKPFLDRVIARIDFSSSHSSIRVNLPPQLNRVIIEKFPIFQPRKVVSQELTFNLRELHEKKESSMEWIFHGRDKDKTTSLSVDHLLITQRKYSSFQQLKDDFLPIAETLFGINKDLQAKRFGLRYINNISISEEDPFNWHEYINDNLLAIFEVPRDKKTIARAFHNLSLNFDDMYLTFQYGMFNPDFPAIIKKKNFILDFDGYYAGIQSYADILENIERFHARIEELFEQNIKDGMRELMGVIRNGQ